MSSMNLHWHLHLYNTLEGPFNVEHNPYFPKYPRQIAPLLPSFKDATSDLNLALPHVVVSNNKICLLHDSPLTLQRQYILLT